MVDHTKRSGSLGRRLLSDFLLGAAIAISVTGPARSDSGRCAVTSGATAADGSTAGMIYVPAGAFTMGSDRQQPEERHPHSVRVNGFWIDQHEVTNAEFAKFVKATSYVTVAERDPDPRLHPDIPKKLLVPGASIFVEPTDRVRGGDITQWWQFVQGAIWRHPESAGSSIDGRENHPVVNVAYEDALAYARWRGHDLPTEAQWEYAAAGPEDNKYPWGHKTPTCEQVNYNRCPDGILPVANTPTDASWVGAMDMGGNVSEWTADWYSDDYYGDVSPDTWDPAGPSSGSTRVVRGGASNLPRNYTRTAYRSEGTLTQGFDSLGFRIVIIP